MNSIFVNCGNSCYIDSIILPIFCTHHSDFRDAILNCSSSPYNYKRVCSTTSKISSIQELTELIKLIRFELHTQYLNIHAHNSSNTHNTSNSLRRVIDLMSEILPDMQNHNHFNACELYDVLCELFPDLKMNIPVVIRNGNTTEYRTNSVNIVQLMDFMSHTDINKDGEYILWNELDLPYLVFQNSSHFPQHLNNTDTELGENEEFVKERCVDEYINVGNNRYKLIVCVLFTGMSNGHYTSIFNKNDKYYYYDDLRMNLIELNDFPKVVWTNTPFKRLELLFYVKCENTKSVNGVSDGMNGESDIELL